MSEKLISGQTEGEEIDIPCGDCLNTTSHIVLKALVLEQVNGYHPEEEYTLEYQIVRCQGCKKISFRKNHWRYMDRYLVGPDEWEINNYEELYPPRTINRKLLKDTPDCRLPPKIRAIYEETHSALCNNNPILAGVGIRAIVETVCKDLNAQGKNLKEKIDDLVTKDLLTKTDVDFLHGTRLVGNEAAHEVEPLPDIILDTAMKVVEHLLEGKYFVSKMADKYLPKQIP